MSCSRLRAEGGGGPRQRAVAAVSLGLCLLPGGARGGAEAAPFQNPPPAAPTPAAPTPAAPEPAAPEPAAPEPLGFQVIVHAGNAVTRLPAKTVSNMFLKKTKRWESGDPVVPVDLEPKDPTRELFTRAVHHKSVSAILRFGQRMVFSGRGSPPEPMSSEEDVLAFVAAVPGAIGYVSDDVELKDGVRQLQVDDLKSTP